MVQIHYKSLFISMPNDVVGNWLDKKRDKLIGSAIFTRNNSITSKMVSWVEQLKCKDKKFVPSHTGSIIEYNGDLYIFDMKPMRASVQPLFEYLITTDDEYALVLRDF